MARHNEFGVWGENVAADYLEQHGYTIVERNWKSGHKEIDIIAANENTVLFVEVKTRRDNTFGNPYESVDAKKRHNLITAMRCYMAIKRIGMPVRFDIISVTGTPESYNVEHLPNAVSNFVC